MAAAALWRCERPPGALVQDACSVFIGQALVSCSSAAERGGVGWVGTLVGIARVGLPTVILAWFVGRFSVDVVQVLGCLTRRCRRAPLSCPSVVSVGTQTGCAGGESQEPLVSVPGSVWVSAYGKKWHVTPRCTGLSGATTTVSMRTGCALCFPRHEAAAVARSPAVEPGATAVARRAGDPGVSCAGSHACCPTPAVAPPKAAG